MTGHASTDVDEFGFKRFDGAFIFIACSSDLTAERIAIERAVEDELRMLSQDGVRVYSWDAQTGPSGPDQRRSMQRNIPRPSSANCIGVVFLVGERIGLPLEHGFDSRFLGASKDWATPGPYRLTLDWPDDHEAACERLREGCYPLTGGVFEFLAARGATSSDQPDGKPVYMAVLADRSVRPDGGEIVLNGNRWFNEMNRSMTPAQRRRFEDTEYFCQTTGVHNFLRACAQRGIAQNPTQDVEQLVTRVRDFVRGRVFGKAAHSENPYRELQHYDAHDGHFYGRRDFVERVIRHLESRLASTARPVSCRITGYSGAGKSSVLRAGVLRELDAPARRGRYRWAVFRPESFKDRAGGDIGVLDTVLDEVEVQCGITLPSAVRRDISRAGASAPVQAARAVLDELDRSGPAQQLLLALDQFEEIVDDLASPRRREYWQPLLRFVEAASQHRNVALIYTLESSRLAQHERLSLPSPFTTDWEEERDDATVSHIHDIIRLPFAKTGFCLGDDVVLELSRQFARLRDDHRAARNSILPLLALKLYELWELVSSEVDPVDVAIAGEAGLGGTASPIGIDQLARYGWTPGFGSILDDLASKAWHRAGVGAKSEMSLSWFLLPFVGIEGQSVQLMAAPRHAPYEDERRLIESFRRHRLLLDVGDGRVRLVHQAVLDHWTAAADWLTTVRPRLERQAAMRVEASEWNNKKRPAPQSRGQALSHKIGVAAEILAYHLRAWALDGAAPDENDTLLRDYCLSIFAKSRTPRRHADEGADPRGSHMGLACAYGLTELVRRFSKIDRQAIHDLSCARSDAQRPLNYAAWAQLDVVRFLLREGANPLAKSASGYSPVMAAIQRNRYDIFQELMEAAVRVTQDNVEADLIGPGRTTLVHFAAQCNHVEGLHDLLDRYGLSGTPRDDSGRSPLHRAAASGALDAFDFLRERFGVTDLTTDESASTCLHLAAAGGHEQIVDRILRLPEGQKQLWSKDNKGRTALHRAAHSQHAACIVTLLNHGLDPNQADDEGLTPFHLSLLSSRTAACDVDRTLAAMRAFLDEPRSDLNHVLPSNWRPLGWLETRASLARELLKDERIDLSLEVSLNGEAGVFVAARRRCWAAVRRYVTSAGGAWFEKTDKDENTILHYCAARSVPKDILLAKMADIPSGALMARNKDGVTPFGRALESKNWELADRMLDVGVSGLHSADRLLDWELTAALNAAAPATVLQKIAAALGARLEQSDSDGWTVLHYVAATNSEVLLSSATPIDVPDTSWLVGDLRGRRPIDFVAEKLVPRQLRGETRRPWPPAVAWDERAGWMLASADEKAAFVSAAGIDEVDSRMWAMHLGALPFYPAARVVRLTHRARGPVQPVQYHLQSGDAIVKLTGKSLPIYEFNLENLRLSADCVREYLHYFCFFVRGQEGPFFVLEDMARAVLSSATTSIDRARIADAVMPTWLIGEDESAFRLMARCFYSTSLFSAYFTVKKTGHVVMEVDHPILASLSGRIEMPLQ